MKNSRRQLCAELNELKGALRARKITYHLLAQKIGRSTAWVSDVMNGFAAPDISDMYSMCDAIGFDGDEIVTFFISPNVAKRKKDAEEKKRTSKLPRGA